MGYLVFLLVVLVLLDIWHKYKKHGLLYYKNNHAFSVIVAITEDSPHLNSLVEMAEKSHHEFIFVNINHAITQSRFQKAHVIHVNATFPPLEEARRTILLSKAYFEGYQHSTKEFLLFMDARLMFEDLKTIAHMANNLVEHQIYTLKETLTGATAKEGYTLFFDILRDINISSDDINYGFFSIKRNTYELANCHVKSYYSIESFAEDLARKNISLLHIDHGQSIYQPQTLGSFKMNLSKWFFEFTQAKSMDSVKRMGMFLLALHVFYFFIVYDLFQNFNILFIAFIPLIHGLIWFTFKPYTRHPVLTYVFIPLYMILFDFLLLVAIVKRWRFYRGLKKQAKMKQKAEAADEKVDLSQETNA